MLLQLLPAPVCAMILFYPTSWADGSNSAYAAPYAAPETFGKLLCARHAAARRGLVAGAPRRAQKPHASMSRGVSAREESES